jgi:hypothetical protein
MLIAEIADRESAHAPHEGQSAAAKPVLKGHSQCHAPLRKYQHIDAAKCALAQFLMAQVSEREPLDALHKSLVCSSSTCLAGRTRQHYWASASASGAGW